MPWKQSGDGGKRRVGGVETQSDARFHLSFNPALAPFFSSSSGSRAASPRFATSKRKCAVVSGALGGATPPRPPPGRTQGSSVLREQPELWCREEDACVLTRAGVAYCRCGRRRRTRVSARQFCSGNRKLEVSLPSVPDFQSGRVKARRPRRLLHTSRSCSLF